MSRSTKSSSPWTDRSLAGVAAVVVVFAIGLLAWAIADVLLLIFAGILMAVFLRGLSDALGQLVGVSDGRALALVLLLLALLLALTGWFLGAEIVSQLDQLIPRLQKAWGHVVAQIRQYEWGRILLANTSFRVLARDKEWLARVGGGVFSSTLGTVASLLVIFFIGLYVAASPRTYRKGFLRLVPSGRRPRTAEVLDAVGDTLRWWLIGTFAKMTAVGVATTVGLMLLGMPLALALGVITFFLEFVPYVGPILSAVPALMVALAVGPMEMLYVALLFLGIHMAEGYIISPLIDQRSVHLPPAVAIVAQVLMGTSFGVLGVFIATPLTAVVMILVKMLYIEDRLGECTDASEEMNACIPAGMPGRQPVPGPRVTREPPPGPTADKRKIDQPGNR